MLEGVVVSVFKILAEAWLGVVAPSGTPAHRVLEDLKYSIGELQEWRKLLFKEGIGDAPTAR